jgi:acyl-coenzyme A synthetase/AMP-(fatty) acid ligase/3-hydroxymyristoyl/3-hydroxydecanoyl-(acyl carrier protein) dehydratase
MTLTIFQLLTPSPVLEKTVAWRSGERISHAQLWAATQAWAAAFERCVGQRVALYFDDAFEFAGALLGAWQAGKQVTLPGDVQPHTVQRLLAQVDICAGLLPGAVQPLFGVQEDAIKTNLRPSSLAPGDDFIALVVFTSGSSGEPQSVPKTFRQLDAELISLQAALGDKMAPDTAVFSTVSHQHLYGLLFHILWPLVSGRAFVAQRLVYLDKMATDLHAGLGEGACALVSSPAHLKRLPDGLEGSWHLQAVFSSGGPLPWLAAQTVQRVLGVSPIEIFGSTETGGMAWRQRALHTDAWQPLPGVQWRVDTGSDLLSVCSPHLPNLQTWHPTQDRVQLQIDGGFSLIGRADQVVKIEEKRVSITAIEKWLLACPEVSDASVVVLPKNAGLGVVVVPSHEGQVFLKQDKKRLNEHLRAQLLQGVERVALPRRFRYVAALPTNAQGKTTQALLVALFRPTLPNVVWRLREADHAQADVAIASDLMAFDGHFENAPILPGLALLDWAIVWGQTCFHLRSDFLRVEALKFQQPVRPQAQLQLDLTWSDATGVLAFVYTSALGRHASGQVIFKVIAIYPSKLKVQG